jgi:hypothetical protein
MPDSDHWLFLSPQPDVAFGEVLVPHFVYGGDLESPSKFFGQWFI